MVGTGALVATFMMGFQQIPILGHTKMTLYTQTAVCKLFLEPNIDHYYPHTQHCLSAVLMFCTKGLCWDDWYRTVQTAGVGNKGREITVEMVKFQKITVDIVRCKEIIVQMVKCKKINVQMVKCYEITVQMVKCQEFTVLMVKCQEIIGIYKF